MDITHPVHLTGLSPSQMSRLRNGHACRCALGSKGEGISAFLGEANIKKLLKAAKKGAKATINLAKHEIEKNKMEGSGLVTGGKLKMPGKLKSVLHSKPVQSLKKKIIDKGQDYVSDQIEHELEKRGVPSSIAKPIARAGTQAGSKKLDKATGGKLKLPKKRGSYVHYDHATMPEAQMKAELRRLGLPTGRVDGKGLYAASGGAIGMPRRVESVGAGGNLLHRHPSQISQAQSANFHFHTQFPPGLAEVRGSGLYV